MSDTAATGNDQMRTMALAVWALYVLSILLGFTSIIGVIIAHVKRAEAAGTIWEGHMIYAIRTFWLTFLGAVLSIPLMLIGIGVLLIIVVSLWFIVRSVVGLLKALDNKPIADPQGWLI